MLCPYHQLGVNDEVDREDDGANSSIDNLEDSVIRDEDHDETANGEDKKDAKHYTPTGSEVYFCLEVRFSLDSIAIMQSQT